MAAEPKIEPAEPLESANASPSEEGRAFVSLDSYVEPTLETASALRRMGHDIWSRLRPQREKRVEFYEKLWQIDQTVQDKLAPPPACGPVIADLEMTIRPWLDDDDTTETAKLIVYPPGHRGRFLRAWAEGVDADIVETESRGKIGASDIDRLNADGLVVIPNLQDWMIRKVGGLDAVRKLLVAVSESDKKIIVGCDSWAWQFLIRTVDAHHLLPDAVVFQPFDKSRLRDWFRTLVKSSEVDDQTVIRSARDGKDIFNDDSSVYFRDLSARSLGIPWVAWSIWRESLFTTKREQLNDSIWVKPAKGLPLPMTEERESLLILHALLIHDGLSRGDLAAVLPVPELPAHIAMLIRAGYISDNEGMLRVERIAYPNIKAALEDASYPGDGL